MMRKAWQFACDFCIGMIMITVNSRWFMALYVLLEPEWHYRKRVAEVTRMHEEMLVRAATMGRWSPK